MVILLRARFLDFVIVISYDTMTMIIVDFDFPMFGLSIFFILLIKKAWKRRCSFFVRFCDFDFVKQNFYIDFLKQNSLTQM